MGISLLKYIHCVDKLIETKETFVVVVVVSRQRETMMLGASRKRKHNEELNAKTYLEKRLSDIAVSSHDRKKSRENVQIILDEMTDRFGHNAIFIRATDEFD